MNGFHVAEYMDGNRPKKEKLQHPGPIFGGLREIVTYSEALLKLIFQVGRRKHDTGTHLNIDVIRI